MLYHHKLTETLDTNEYIPSELDMPSGAIFYAPLDKSSSTAETGQVLTYSGTFTYENDSGIPCTVSPVDEAYIESNLTSETSNFTKISYSLWYRKTNSDDSFYVCAFGKDGSDKRLALYYYIDYGLSLNFGGTTVSDQPAPINFIKWNHLVLTYDSSTQEAKAYLNGILFSSSSHLIDIFPGSIYLFTRPDHQAGSPSNSRISSVRIYDKILTQLEITTLSQEFIPKVEYTSSGFNNWGKPIKYRSAELADCNINFIPTDGLVFWYSFNGENTSKSDIGNKSISLNNGQVSYLTENGIKCAYFNNGGLNCQLITEIQYQVPFSSSIWFKGTSQTVDNIFWKFGDTSGDPSSGLSISVNKTQNKFLIQSSGTYEYLTTNTFDLTVWHNIIIVYNGSKISVYIDGIKNIDVNGWNFKITTQSDGTFGRINSFQYPVFYGYLSSARVYNRILLDSEIESISREFKPIY